MNRHKFPGKILIYEAVGFLAILVFTLADTIYGFPRQYLVPHSYYPTVWEASFETIGILAIAITALIMTQRLLSRLFYLETFLMLCVCCKKVNHEGQWISMMEYFKSGFETKINHGMCPECSKKTMQTFPI